METSMSDDDIVYIDDFPGCCGIYVIYEFRNQGIRKINISSVENKVRQLLKKNVGLYLISLNHIQKPTYAEMMKRLNFQEIVSDFYSPQHGNTITLYGHVVHGTGMKPDARPDKTTESYFQNLHVLLH